MKNRIQYLAFDSLDEGVGASQILNYVEKLSLDAEITLINFEKRPPSEILFKKMESMNVTWKPLAFGNSGLLPGLSRVFRMSLAIDRDVPVHARGDLAALAAIIKLNRKVLWDCRALQADQRFAISNKFGRKIVYFLNRSIESLIARRSKKINVITSRAKLILSRRYKLPLSKFSVISTCVDLDKFTLTKMPSQSKISLFIPGTLSAAYDIKLMNKIILELRKKCSLEVTLALGNGADIYWKDLDYDHVVSIPHSKIPEAIKESHFGMSIWKADLGICLSSVSSTKIPEFLSIGRPSIVNFNQGDIGHFLESNRCGVATTLDLPEYVQKYADDIMRLIRDDATAERCHGLAREEYSLGDAVPELIKLYADLEASK
jgi:hypothetical protein